jgi:hypothetical protein
MSYRAQYPHPEPAGCRVESFEYFFDQIAVPEFQSLFSLSVGQELRGIPLVMLPDAPFMWHASKVRVSLPAGYVLGMRFRTPEEQYMESDYIPLNLYCEAAPATQTSNFPTTLEPAVYCRAGAVVLVDFKRLS